MPVRIYREALADLLTKSVSLRVLGTVSALDDETSNGFPVQPDIVLLDRRDPDCFRIASATLRTFAGSKLVAVGGGESDEEMDACAGAGICGHVAADAPFEELVATIQQLARGDMPCSPRIAAALVRRVTAIVTKEPHSSIGLTRREMEVVSCLREALSNKEIARRLDIEVATVKNHIHNILRKLAVHRRVDAVTATSDRI